ELLASAVFCAAPCPALARASSCSRSTSTNQVMAAPSTNASSAHNQLWRNNQPISEPLPNGAVLPGPPAKRRRCRARMLPAAGSRSGRSTNSSGALSGSLDLDPAIGDPAGGGGVGEERPGLPVAAGGDPVGGHAKPDELRLDGVGTP